MIGGVMECVLLNQESSADSTDHYAAYDAEVSAAWSRG
jgi:hypothetical protein